MSSVQNRAWRMITGIILGMRSRINPIGESLLANQYNESDFEYCSNGHLPHWTHISISPSFWFVMVGILIVQE